jgi:L-Ala-D/L-Glu epimerase
VLKIKLGGGDDHAVVEQVRRCTAKPLRVDVNEGWRDREQAIRDIEWLAGRGVELVEQPLPRAMLADTAWLKARSPLPLIADESVRDASDLPAVAAAFHGVNVKLMKAGGLIPAWRTLLAARAFGLECMLGCMIESSAGIAAAIQLQPLARWADLDGNLLLSDDPFERLQLHEGVWRMPPGSGIGVHPGRELSEGLA